MDIAMVDMKEVMGIVFEKQLDVARYNDYAMEGLDSEQKIMMLEYLKKYFVKIEDYEICKELQEQLDKIQSVSGPN